MLIESSALGAAFALCQQKENREKLKTTASEIRATRQREKAGIFLSLIASGLFHKLINLNVECFIIPKLRLSCGDGVSQHSEKDL